jgi:hypothetical protein
MIVKIDKEASFILSKLCDIALRAGGLQNMVTIGTLLSSVELLSEPQPPTPVNPDKKDPIQYIIKT